ncbi:lysozyme [Moraxella boevrei]|uniref:lysozyme n=1 Tax=Faucicola boevrei TaxID=346665 RepID=UPI0037359B95
MKEFFDWFRDEMGGKLTQAQVDFANELLATMDVEQAKIELLQTYKKQDWQMKLSNKGFEMLAVFEGFRSNPYRDSVGVATIGYGNTYYLDGSKVKMTDPPISKDEAKRLKMAVINKDFAPAVNNLLEHQIKAGQINQNMFDALISLAYNIGVGALAKSSVIRHLKNGDKQASADSFLLWNKAGGKVLKGLVNRRNAERAGFLA